MTHLGKVHIDFTFCLVDRTAVVQAPLPPAPNSGGDLHSGLSVFSVLPGGAFPGVS